VALRQLLLVVFLIASPFYSLSAAALALCLFVLLIAQEDLDRLKQKAERR
jgi:hypothetical protein